MITGVSHVHESLTQRSARPNLFVLSAAISLVAAVWAVLTQSGRLTECASCDKAADVVGGLNLAWLAVTYYSLLLMTSLLAFVRRDEPAMFWAKITALGFVVAAGVHLTLVALLLRYRVLCPACLLTAAGGFIGGGVALVAFKARTVPVLALMVVAAGACWGGVRVAREAFGARHVRLAQQVQRQVLSESPPGPGSARLVVYVREGCGACVRFRREVLTPLQRQYGHRLTIEERPAFKGMMSPTSVIVGRKPALFIGIQPLETVARSVGAALGAASTRSSSPLGATGSRQ